MHRVIRAALCLGIPFMLAAGAAGQESKTLAELSRAIGTGHIRVVDLTHAISEQSPFWPRGDASSPYRSTVVATLDHDGYYMRDFTLTEHFGTHTDAPSHFAAGGANLDEIPVEEFVAEAVVVDVSAAVEKDADYRVTAADLERWMKAHGPIPGGGIVFFRTGWAERWPSQARYMNQDARGVLHFPGLSLEAAKSLLTRAHPVAIGIDTPSVDYGPSKNFEVHHLTMGAGLYHLESVANLDQLPATGALVIALPLMLRGGSGSPTRVVALVPKTR